VWEWLSGKPECRGGSFYGSSPSYLRVGGRLGYGVPSCLYVGFRVARTP